MKYFSNPTSFAKWFLEVFPNTTSMTDIQYVVWNVCLYNADMLLDGATRSDVASLYFNGMDSATKDPLNTITILMEGFYDDIPDDLYKDGDDITEEHMGMYAVTDFVAYIKDLRGQDTEE